RGRNARSGLIPQTSRVRSHSVIVDGSRLGSPGGGNMFDAIASPKPSGRSGRSIAVSVAIHRILLGAVLASLYTHVSPAPVAEASLPTYHPGPPAAPFSGSKRQTPRAERAKPRPAPRPIIEPKWTPPPPVEEPVEDVIGNDSGDGSEGVPW